MAGLWTCLFAVFSFGFDMDPDSCIVSNKDDLIAERIPFVDKDDPDDPSTIDVAVRFRFFFTMAFFMSCTQLVLGIVGLFMGSKETFLKRLFIFLLWLANLAIMLLWAFAFTVRYMHSGCQCSGDFIIQKKEADKLLHVEGMFLKFSSLLLVFIFLLIFMGHLINYCQKITGGNQIEIDLEI